MMLHVVVVVAVSVVSVYFNVNEILGAMYTHMSYWDHIKYNY